MRLRLLCIPQALLFTLVALAQAPPGRDKASTVIGGKTITIEYGSPALKGRSFDDMMKKLPADRIWRAGSGPVTTLTTEAPLMIGGSVIPSGKYSLYVHCPEQGDFSLVINKDLGQPLNKIFAQAPPNIANDPYPHYTAYTKEIGDMEAARLPMKRTSGPSTDVFTITFKPAQTGAAMLMSWGENVWTLDIAPGK